MRKTWIRFVQAMLLARVHTHISILAGKEGRRRIEVAARIVVVGRMQAAELHSAVVDHTEAVVHTGVVALEGLVALEELVALGPVLGSQPSAHHTQEQAAVDRTPLAVPLAELHTGRPNFLVVHSILQAIQELLS